MLPAHPRSPRPSTTPPVACWSGPALGLLVVLGLSLGVRFAANDPAGLPRPEPWPGLVVDANSAPVPVLEALPGLGPALVGRIDAARAVAPLRSLVDLDCRVKGIGPAKVAGLRPFLRFGER